MATINVLIVGGIENYKSPDYSRIGAGPFKLNKK